MTEKELLSLKKSELLEIMLAQSREIDSLRAQLEAQKAADLYLENVKKGAHLNE